MFALTVSPFVAPGHKDGLGNQLFVVGGQEPSLPGVDDLVRLGRVRCNLRHTSRSGDEMVSYI